MLNKFNNQIKLLFSKWKLWIIQLIIHLIFWLLEKLQDEILDIIFYFIKDNYGKNIVERLFLLIPKNFTGLTWFILVLSLVGIYIYNLYETSKEKKAVAVSSLNKNDSLKFQEKDKIQPTFKEKRKEATNEISKLINIAVRNSIMFSQGVSYENEPSMDEQYKNARKSGRELMNYFESDNNRLFFSKTARTNIKKLYELISVCTQKMNIAMSTEGNRLFDVKLWNEYSEKLQEIKVLKDKIDSEFHEFLVNSDET